MPATLSDDPKRSAISAGLRYVSDDSTGITRKRAGSGFTYYDVGGALISDPMTLKRIRSLVVPPAWKNVWICSRPNGHLQATGTDARGRKQYKYHQDWRKVRDEAKYDRLMSFAQALSRIRGRLNKHMKLPSVCREKVLATVVKLLEVSLM